MEANAKAEALPRWAVYHRAQLLLDLTFKLIERAHELAGIGPSIFGVVKKNENLFDKQDQKIRV